MVEQRSTPTCCNGEEDPVDRLGAGSQFKGMAYTDIVSISATLGGVLLV